MSNKETEKRMKQKDRQTDRDGEAVEQLLLCFPIDSKIQEVAGF